MALRRPLPCLSPAELNTEQLLGYHYRYPDLWNTLLRAFLVVLRSLLVSDAIEMTGK